MRPRVKQVSLDSLGAASRLLVSAVVLLAASGCASRGVPTVVESVPPEVQVLYPSMETRTETSTPTIEVRYRDLGSGILVTSFRARINGRDYSADFDHHTHGATGRIGASRRLRLGENLLVVELRDRAGNLARQEVNFVNAGGGWLRVVAAPGAEPPRYVDLILDASGSMGRQLAFTTRMEIAKEAIRSLISSVPSGTPLGLRVFRNCGDIESLVPIEAVDRESYVHSLEAVEPAGGTPLLASLLNSFDALAQFRDGQRVAVLITDGGETCDMELMDVVVGRAQDAATRVIVIAFDIDDRGVLDELIGLAESTGGAFYDARDPAQLKEALERSVLRVDYAVEGEFGVSSTVGFLGDRPLELDPGVYTVRLATVPPLVVTNVAVGRLTETLVELRKTEEGLVADVWGPVSTDASRSR